MSFSEILARERKQRGMSQEELSSRIQVSRQAVSKWETGDAMPDLPKLLALADALGLSLDALCGREPPASAAVPTSAGGSASAGVPTSAGGSASAAVPTSVGGSASAAVLPSAGSSASPASSAPTAPVSSAPSAPSSLAPASFTGGKLLLAALLCVLLGAITAGALLWSWTRRSTVPAEEAAAQSLRTMAEELTVSGLSFRALSDTCVEYRFTPSISGGGLTFEITFMGDDGQPLSFDAPCSGGICTGEAFFPGSHAYDSYNVTVSVTDGTVLRALAVAADLRFSQGQCSWTPLTE